MSLALHVSITGLKLIGQVQERIGGMRQWDDMGELQEVVQLRSGSVAEF